MSSFKGGLTVAIPTYRRWSGFLEKSLPLYLANPLITHVIVCDETGEDAAAIRASPLRSNPKLTVYSNDKRLGAYQNKRQCIEKAKTEWVAVLDSDNIFPEEFFEVALETLEEEKFNPRLVLVAGINIRLFLKTGQQENRTSHFKGLRITRDTWNRVLEMPAWNFLLNDGNYIVHRSTYAYLSPNYTLSQVQAADAILAAKQFVQHGCIYYIVPDMRYIHTVHDDSEWLKTDRESTRILNTTDWRILPEN